MSRLSTFVTTGLALVVGLSASELKAATIEVDATQVGGFFEDGSADNEVTFQNYYLGYSTLSTLAVRRSFFYFDLSGVTDPVVSAEFSITLPFGGLFFGGDGMGGFEVEDFILSGTDHSLIGDILDSSVSAADAMTVWAALGDPMTAIGTAGFDPSMPPMVPTEGLEILIPIDASGIALINMHLGGDLMLSGRMLDVSPLMPTGEMDELIFGLSDVVPMGGMAGDPGTVPAPALTLITTPEPESISFGFIGTLFLTFTRRRQHSV